jgi:hypothetical protein
MKGLMNERVGGCNGKTEQPTCCVLIIWANLLAGIRSSSFVIGGSLVRGILRFFMRLYGTTKLKEKIELLMGFHDRKGRRIKITRKINA